MNPSNYKIQLDPRLDKDDNIYFLGKVRYPGTIDFRRGLTILAFTADEELEELQIAVNDKENSSYSKLDTKKLDEKKTRIKIPLTVREDSFGKNYYVCKVRSNLVIDCFDEVVFFLYTSKKGKEEVQVIGSVNQSQIKSKKEKSIEIDTIYRRPPNVSSSS